MKTLIGTTNTTRLQDIINRTLVANIKPRLLARASLMEWQETEEGAMDTANKEVRVKVHRREELKDLVRDNCRNLEARNYRLWMYSDRRSAWENNKKDYYKNLGTQIAITRNKVQNHKRDIEGKHLHLDQNELDIIYTLKVINYLELINSNSPNTRRKIEPQYYALTNGYYKEAMEWDEIEWTKFISPDDIPISNSRYSEYITFDNTKEDQESDITFYRKLQHLNTLHHLHFSIKQPQSVAYYPTLDHLRNKREVVTKIGRYLTKYANFLGLSEPNIRDIANSYLGMIRAKEGWTIEVIPGRPEIHLDKDTEIAEGILRADKTLLRDQWLNAYASEHSAVQSCMTNKKCIQVYVHEFSCLQLVVLRSKADGNRIIARSIVRDDENKGYIRIYPSSTCSEGKHLMSYLQSNGYSNTQNFQGVLLDCIRLNDYNDNCQMPYLDHYQDHESFGKIVEQKNPYGVMKEFIEVGHDKYQDHDPIFLGNTDGESEYNDEDEDEDGENCCCCEDWYNPDEMSYIDEGTAHGYYCSSCQDQYIVSAQTAHYSGLTQCIKDGGIISINVDDAVYCATDDEYYLNEPDTLKYFSVVCDCLNEEYIRWDLDPENIVRIPYERNLKATNGKCYTNKQVNEVICLDLPYHSELGTFDYCEPSTAGFLPNGMTVYNWDPDYQFILN